MNGPRGIRVAEVRNPSDIDFESLNGLSFFGPYLRYHTKEVLETGGEVYVSRTSKGAVSGLFLYDGFEKTGTIYTRSREVFDHFYGMKRFNFLFSEMSTEHESEIYDIYTIDLGHAALVHGFRHEVSIMEEDTSEIERFMVSTTQGMNKGWVKVALKNGDRCFVVRLGDEIAGLGWLSIVNGIGRLHSLYVKPQFRRMGMGGDILYARLLWLKARAARSAFSEISRYAVPSSILAAKAHMTVSGQVFRYFRRETDEQERPLGRQST